MYLLCNNHFLVVSKVEFSYLKQGNKGVLLTLSERSHPLVFVRIHNPQSQRPSIRSHSVHIGYKVALRLLFT